MRLRSCFALLFMLASSFSFAFAQGVNRTVFIVPEVPVFAKASTAAEAQKIAQRKGRLQAMDILLRRLTAEEDWQYLPTLATGAPASAGALVEPEAPESDLFGIEFDEPINKRTKSALSLNPADLDLFSEGLAIFDEKTSATTYRARITYRFKPEGIRNMLEIAGLPYSESQARRALIIPILETRQGTYLWETRNPWARAWLARPLENELTPMILPRGDRQDMSIAALMDVENLNPVALSQLSARYQAPQVILALGRLEDKDGEFLFRVKFIDAYLDGRGGNRQRIDAAAALYDDEEGFGAGGVDQSSPDERGRVLAETFFRGPNDDFPALANRAVEYTVARYADGWKQRTLIDHSLVRPLNLTAWFTSLDEWADIRIALETTPLVREMDVQVFSNQSAVIDLVVIGEQNQFVLDLNQENLTVWQSYDGSWNIAGFDLAEELQMTMSNMEYERPFSDMTEGQRAVNRPGGGEFRPAVPTGLRGTQDVSPEGREGSPTTLELPEDLFGPAEEPERPENGAPVALEQNEPEQNRPDYE